MTDTILTQDCQGYTITIEYDREAANPREFYEGSSTMACLQHRRYTLGDEQLRGGQDELNQLLKDSDKIALPVHMYDHSGLAFNTTGFSCSFDSGRCGVIYMFKDIVKAEYGANRISEKLRNKIIARLQSEVNEYGEYIEGNVMQYVIKDSDGEALEYSGGYYGDLTQCLADAQTAVAGFVKAAMPLFDAVGVSLPTQRRNA